MADIYIYNMSTTSIFMQGVSLQKSSHDSFCSLICVLHPFLPKYFTDTWLISYCDSRKPECLERGNLPTFESIQMTWAKCEPFNSGRLSNTKYWDLVAQNSSLGNWCGAVKIPLQLKHMANSAIFKSPQNMKPSSRHRPNCWCFHNHRSKPEH